MCCHYLYLVAMKNTSQPVILKSAPMLEVYRLVKQVAPTKVTVLITGETGVGKEIIARQIHDTSSRKRKPFKAINCSAFPDNGLLQSELFGHEKGAFTGAVHQRTGLFEQADTGILFLDEVGEMNPEAQAILLRVLETQEFTRLGGNKTVKVDVRVITATNKCLETAVKNEEFREDLYYRLNRFHIHIPPLRERREDILPLVDDFVAELSVEHNKHITRITSEARNFLKHAALPGNIRQLKNAIDRAIIATKTDELTLRDLPTDITIMPQTVLPSMPSNLSDYASIPTEVHQILSQISVTEFILIFAEIPNAVWRMLPEETQQSIIREASFHLSMLLGGQQDAIRIDGMDRNQILAKVAHRRIEEHGSATKAAASLGIDRRTLKTYTETEK